MVDAAKGYDPSSETRALVAKILGDGAHFDSGYNKNITLKKTEAERRFELVDEIEYDFQIAINKGDHYIGIAVVNFYLKETPNDGDLWLDFQAVAISDLTINDKKLPGKDLYQDQRLKLNKAHVAKGWNTVMLRYVNPYNTNRVGLHTYTDASDK